MNKPKKPTLAQIDPHDRARNPGTGRNSRSDKFVSTHVKELGEAELKEQLAGPSHGVLTYAQKLKALADRFYSGVPWQPKAGDYYTSSRDDLELYKIESEDDEHFYTIYCDRACTPSKWRKEEFLKDFGERRVYVAPWVLAMAS